VNVFFFSTTRSRASRHQVNGGHHGQDRGHLNIEHFRKKLVEEIDETKRQTIPRLLAEEEAKLAALMNPTKERKAQS
jgi:hypothetical protein